MTKFPEVGATTYFTIFFSITHAMNDIIDMSVAPIIPLRFHIN